MRIFLFLTAALLLAGVAGGCSTPREELKMEGITREDHAEVDLFARKVGDMMLTAYQKRDYDAFSEFFAPELAERLDETDFKQLRADLGEWKNKEYLTGLHNPSFASYIWKVTFVQLSEGKFLTFETLFQMSIVKRSGEYQVVGCWFR